MWRTATIGGILAGIAWSVLATAPAHAGEVRGQIIISQGLTKKRVSIADYNLRGPAVAEHMKQASEYERIAIYLEAQFPPLVPPTSAALRQKNQRFEPEVLIVPVGSDVSFPNDDPIFHNVFSLSPAKPFDLGYYPQGETRAEQFERPGIVQVFCHLHPQMSAAIVVVPSPWQAKPDANGTFSFSHVPAGIYQLVVWHKSAGFFRRRVEAPAQGSVSISVEIPVKDSP